MFGEAAREHRRRSALTQEDLAAKTGLSVRHIRDLEAGRIARPRPATMLLLADAFGLYGAERDRFLTGAPAPVPSSGVPAQLPADGYGFVGRADSLARLDEILARSADQPTAMVLATVSGTAGVGKTTLAVHWAHRVARHFPDGQLYVNLRGFDPTGTPVSPSTALAGFVNALTGPGDRMPTTMDEQIARYRSLLNGRRVLVLLDNAGDAGQVRPLLPGAPGCVVLVTSRDQLPGLVSVDGAHPITLNLLTPDESRELLTRRLGADRVTAEPAAVDAIVGASAGLPLALSVVAARAAIHSGFALTELAADLRPAADHLDSARLDAFDGGEPVTDLRLVMSWSYRTLDEPTARLFRLLSVHPGPDFSVAAAASLAGIAPSQARRRLTELTRAHLLTEHRPGRYTCHDLLRAYAAELASELDTAADQHAARSRVFDHYLAAAYAADKLLYPQRDRLPIDPPGPGVATVTLADRDHAIGWFGDEHPVLLSVLQGTADHGFDQHTCHLAWAVTTYLLRRGYWQDWTSSLQAALAATVRLGDHRAEAYAHNVLAFADISLSRYADAQRHLEQAFDRYRLLGDLAGQARVELNLGWICDQNNQPEGALGHAQEALRLHRAAGHVTGQAFALNAIGWSHAQLGDHQAALASCEQALALFVSADNLLGQAITWGSTGHAHLELGATTEAVRSYEHAVRLRREIGDRQLEAEALGLLGDAHAAAGDPASAQAAWRQALDILVSLGADTGKIQAKLAAAN
ncbi:tetratricopeptide (TPR) repeat protein/transcriptional regulator with XRE-family HTH domain [Hamadaea flava]|uniref:ATP-binding protein n=1 Tax=Hamadaea flava TaxID=1742688 RepID=A0ABV8LJT2_9ACTN|nr:XRE family transcriptional regulator [Hamadaea flava]MCP2323683.1 tetratricopeptide (TPR) repeat protein/transcriptional regulator with XRE-family HTH domain [Hamadaea flava]